VTHPYRMSAFEPTPREIWRRWGQNVAFMLFGAASLWAVRVLDWETDTTNFHRARTSVSGATYVALTTTDWYVDPANETGCASNSNNGTSPSCDGVGIGPLMKLDELYKRWGTHMATVPVGVTIHFVSSETAQ
jgi:hypothetical protein